MKISILGAGAWGTSVAVVLGKEGRDVSLFPRREEHADALITAGENEDYLPGIQLDGVSVKKDLEDLRDSDIVLFACPSKALRETATRVKEFLPQSVQMLIALCKGVEPETFKTPSQVLGEVFSGIPVGMLSGPNAAIEVAQLKPTASVLASGSISESDFLKVQEALSTPSLRIYRSYDVLGVELGSCLKNVYAIGAGLCDGLSLGDNAKSAYLTRVLHEMVRLGVALGGQQESFYGLSGFGDLIATSHGSWSRNRTFGEKVGRGEAIDALLSNRKTVVEGYRSTASFFAICQREGIDMPIMQEVYSVLYEKKSPKNAILALMTRSLKEEKAL